MEKYVSHLLASLALILVSLFYVSVAQACGSYQTCNAVFITDTRTDPETGTFNGVDTVRYTPEQDTVKFEVDVFEFANWYYTFTSTMYPAVVIAQVGDRTFFGSITSYTTSGPQLYGPSLNYWYVQTAQWTFEFEWDGKDSSGNYVNTPQLARITAYTGAQTAISIRLMLPVTAASKKEQGLPGCEKSVGDPCNAVTGNTYKDEQDYRNGDGTLHFARHYNSLEQADTGLGVGWTSNVYRRLNRDNNTLVVTQSDGRNESFSFDGSDWSGDSDTRLRLTEEGNSFIITQADGAEEVYDLSGKLLSESDRNGNTTTYSYDVDERLQRVTGPYGHNLSFSYDIDGHLTGMTDPDGNTTAYHYDTANNLIQVDHPDGHNRQYLYQDSSPNLLTGIVDGNGDQFVSYRYDAQGRAIETALAIIGGSPQELFSIAYNDVTHSVAVTDAAGHEKVLTYDENLGVRNVVNRVHSDDGNAIQQSYDANNNLLSRTDEAGIATTYTYNADNQQLSMTEATGTTEERTTTYDYVSNDIDLPVKISRPSAYSGATFETVISRDANHNPAAITYNGYTTDGVPVTRALSMAYNSRGQLIQLDGPRSDTADVTTYSYYDCTTGVACGQLQSVVNALGQATTYDSYDAHGRVTQITNANGLQTTLNYDTRGRLTTKTTAAGTPDTATTTFTYDAVGQITRITLPNGAFLHYSYDAAHRLIAISDNLNNTLTYTLDVMGNRTQENITDPSGSLSQTQTRTYNSLNRLTQTIGANLQTTTYNYDAQGNNIDIQDALYRNTGAGFDALNRLINTTNTENNNSTYSYDALDHLISITDPKGLATTYSTNAFGDILSQTSPDTGTTTTTYDNAGNAISQTDAKGITVTYNYDAINRLTNISYPDTTQNISYTYDSATGVTCTYAIGRLCTVTEPSGTTSYQYDSRGNQTSQTTTLNGINRSVNNSYDIADNLIQTTYPNGRSLDYGRDSAGRIVQVTTTDNGITDIIATGINYQPFGALNTLNYGNGINETRAYDLDARLTALDISSAFNQSYNYDAVNNITAISNLLDTSRSESFTYDLMDRLNLAQGNYGDLSYTYDANSNRTSKTEDSTTKTYNYAAASHQLNDITDDTTSTIEDTRSYDANGNTTTITNSNNSNDNITLTYNDNNRLSQTNSDQTTTSYRYNAKGERVIKQSNNSTTTTTTLYYYNQNGQLIAELDGSGNTVREILWLDNKPLALITADTTSTNSDPDIQILDNDNGTASGNWTSSTWAPGYAGNNYQYHTGNDALPDAVTEDNNSASFIGNWPVSTWAPGYTGNNYQYHAGSHALPNAVTADNPSASYTGNWPTSTWAPGYTGNDYQYQTAGSGENSATWTLNIPTTGSYNVYAQWTTGSNRATNAPYTINHANGSNTINANQQTNGGQFN
ncbi:MAG: hypothetical protein JKY93_08830, partial [Gammaproteobacteria bacterium]|nr:hypothetical protein [Gammaproteobacteria bacterium]